MHLCHHFWPNGSLWTGLSRQKYYVDLSYGLQLRFGPYNELGVTNRSINCHLTLSAMNYLYNKWRESLLI